MTPPIATGSTKRIINGTRKRRRRPSNNAIQHHNNSTVSGTTLLRHLTVVLALCFVPVCEGVPVAMPSTGMKLIVFDEQDVDEEAFRKALHQAALLHLYTQLNTDIVLETTIVKANIDDDELAQGVSLSVLRVGLEGTIEYEFPVKDQALNDVTRIFGQDTGFWEFAELMAENDLLARTGKIQIAVQERIVAEGSLISDEDDVDDDLSLTIIIVICVICGLVTILLVVAVVMVLRKRKEARIKAQKQQRRTISRARQIEMSSRDRSLSSWSSSRHGSMTNSGFQLQNSGTMGSGSMSLSSGALGFSPRKSPMNKKVSTLQQYAAKQKFTSPDCKPQRVLTQLEKKQKALEKRQTQNSSKLLCILEDLDELEEEDEESEEAEETQENSSGECNTSSSSDLIKFSGSSNSNSLSLSAGDDRDSLKMNSHHYSSNSSDLIQLNESADLKLSPAPRDMMKNMNMSMHMSAVGENGLFDMSDSVDETEVMKQSASDNSDLIQWNDSGNSNNADSFVDSRNSDFLNVSANSADTRNNNLHMSCRLDDAMFDMNFEDSTTNNNDESSGKMIMDTSGKSLTMSSPSQSDTKPPDRTSPSMPSEQRTQPQRHDTEDQRKTIASDSPAYCNNMMSMNMSQLDKSCMFDLNFEESSHNTHSTMMEEGQSFHLRSSNENSMNSRGSLVFHNPHERRGSTSRNENNSRHSRNVQTDTTAENNNSTGSFGFVAEDSSHTGNEFRVDGGDLEDIALEDNILCDPDAIHVESSDNIMYDNDHAKYWTDHSVDLGDVGDEPQELSLPPSGYSEYDYNAPPTPRRSSNFHFT